MSDKDEAARLVAAATVYWRTDRLAAIRMAKQAVVESARSPERAQRLLEELDLVAEMTPG